MARNPKTDEVSIIPMPLVGIPTTRTIASSNAAFSSSGIVGLGIVGLMVVGNLLGGNVDQRYVNAIPDKLKNPLTGAETFYLYKRPGFEAHTTPAAGNIGTAIRVWTGQGSGGTVVTAFGPTNSTLYENTTALSGGSHATVAGIVEYITETIVGATPTIVANTTARAYWYQNGGNLTEITDVDFPGVVGGGKTLTGSFVHLDGYAFIMCTDGTIWNSDLNSIANWSASSYLSSNMYPDQGVGLARYKDLIVAFGRETIEFFRNVGNPLGSPLMRVSEAFIKLGCIGPTAICQLEDNIAWVGSSDIGSISIYMLNGYTPTRISTPIIDAQLALASSSTIYLTSIKMFGKTFLIVNAGTTTFVYCMEDGIWHEWGGTLPRWTRMAANTAASPVIYSISRTLDSGKVYKINPVAPVYQDDGETYTVQVQTSIFDLNKERRKRLRKLSVIGDKYSSTNEVHVSWADDDYQNFSTARTVDLANDRAYLMNCGQFRRRAFRLTNTSSLPLRLERLELEIRENVN